MNIVAILANGVGTRFGSNVPKQFHKVNGKMVIEYVIESILQAKNVDKIVIATNVEANSVYLADICESCNIDLVEGGSTRNRTLKNVIDYIDANYDCKKMIVCDAVRPMITGELMDKYFDMLDGKAAVVTAQKITDSLGCYKFQKVNREDYYLMQSPEGFDFPLLRDSFDSESILTEVTQQLPENSEIELYFDFNNNFKLTYPADLKYLEALIKERENHIEVDNILDNVVRLKNYLSKYYPTESQKWVQTLKVEIPDLLQKWQIDEYNVIKTSHFGIIFLAHSIKYGKCVLKIIPPFIERYEQERACYQSINANFMCEMFDFDDNCSAILLERCNEVEKFKKITVVEFFNKVMNSSVNTYSSTELYHNYSDILHNKICVTDFDYRKDEIMLLVEKAVRLYDETFSSKDETLIHGDMHRYNIMSKNGQFMAIDPIGYIAPVEIDIARFIGTELTEAQDNIKVLFDDLIEEFSVISDKRRLKIACFIDMVFRLHNSLFENDDYILTDKWLKVLNETNIIH